MSDSLEHPHGVHFSRRLCERPHPVLSPAQRNLFMAFLPYLGVPAVGPKAAEISRDLIEAGLKAFSPVIGPWKLVWGPGIYQVINDVLTANTMFVAEHQETGELVVSIAGTNPFSAYAWLIEDFQVGETRTWDYGHAPPSVVISKGTLKGLQALQGMVSGPDMSSPNLSLREFLAARVAASQDQVHITVTGHSLGGALSPTLALWLLDTQDDWDPERRAELEVWAYAGPTAGDADFARYLKERFGDRLHRIANTLDPAVHVWNVPDIAAVKALYVPQIPRNKHWDKAVDTIIAMTNGVNYRQYETEPELILEGKVFEGLVWKHVPALLNFVTQAIYQHTVAYFDLLELDYPEDRSDVVAHMLSQVHAFAEPILERTDHSRLVSEAVAMGLQLLASVYARIGPTTALLPDPRDV